MQEESLSSVNDTMTTPALKGKITRTVWNAIKLIMYKER